MSVTLADFEIRYANIRKHFPTDKCSIRGCNNPQDVTTHGGGDSCCAYHRMLFDRWSYDLEPDTLKYYLGNQRARRSAFTRWRNKLGKEMCDKIVLQMAQEAINWVC
ncbi:hypothetical protein D4R42_04515 [bacterium]|nr:MAG: hypothetical protein D4R42_04515 [bacterium]